MALFNRVSRLFQADFSAVLDHLEEPEQLLKLAIRDMADDLEATQRRVAAVGQASAASQPVPLRAVSCHSSLGGQARSRRAPDRPPAAAKSRHAGNHAAREHECTRYDGKCRDGLGVMRTLDPVWHRVCTAACD